MREGDDLGTEHLRLERRDALGWCIVDRPEARNAVTPAMYRGLAAAVRIVTDDPSLRALVITGTADVFIPGGDLQPEGTTPLGLPHAPSEVLPFTALRNSRVPVVAAVNGICQASGLMVALLADVALASDRATFRAPELLRGFADTWLAAVLPAHLGVGRARELVMTGRIVQADEAVAIGLVERVVSHDDLSQEAERTAMQLLEAAPHAWRAWKRAVNSHYGVVDEMTMDDAPASPEVAEGAAAFFERRPPAWSPRAR